MKKYTLIGQKDHVDGGVSIIEADVPDMDTLVEVDKACFFPFCSFSIVEGKVPKCIKPSGEAQLEVLIEITHESLYALVVEDLNWMKSGIRRQAQVKILEDYISWYDNNVK